MGQMPASGPPQITPAPPVLDQGIIDEEPPNKKIRSEDNLVPEADFIAMHKVQDTLELLHNLCKNDLYFIYKNFRVPSQFKYRFLMLLTNLNGNLTVKQ